MRLPQWNMLATSKKATRQRTAAPKQRRRRFFESLEERRVMTNAIITSVDTTTEGDTTSLRYIYIDRNSQDSPLGINGDSLSVSYTFKGDAIPGMDYYVDGVVGGGGTEDFSSFEPSPDDNYEASKYRIVPIDDDFPEGDENVFLEVTNHSSGEDLDYVITTPVVHPVQDNDGGIGPSNPLGTGGGGSGNSGRPAPKPRLEGCTSCSDNAAPNQVNAASNAGASDSAPKNSGGGADESSKPVRYADGVMLLASSDLSSDFNGTTWGITRHWTNDNRYARLETFGMGMVIAEQPVLMIEQLGTGATPAKLAMIADGHTSYHFNLEGSAYQSFEFHKESLTYDSANDQYVVTDTAGAQFRFYGFNATPNAHRGQIVSYKDPGGNAISYIYDGFGMLTEMSRSSTVGTTVVDESFLLKYKTYFGGGGDTAGVGMVQNVALKRREYTSGGSAPAWDTVTSIREAHYTYYGTGDSNGNRSDLKTVEIKDGSGNILDTTYYRYYTGTANGIGYQRGLKYVLRPDSFARLNASLTSPTTPFTAADNVVKDYADNYFEYNTAKQVSKEVAQGAGCSCPSTGGQGTFQFSYLTNTSGSYSDDFNKWKTKTTETLPDGNENIVFTNHLGQVLLYSFHDKDTDGGGPDVDKGEWTTYYRYDADDIGVDGQVVLIASPAAVDGYSQAAADLAVDLNDGEGLITELSYYTSGATGYLQGIKIRQGETGTLVPQLDLTYTSQAVNGHTIYLVATSTVYAAEGGGSSLVESYAYTYYSGAFQVQSKTVTNWSGGSTIAVYDTYGRPIWTRDQENFINYIEFDQTSGALEKLIVDVNTTLVGNEPIGWESNVPTTERLHLTTAYNVDDLGRPTQITDAKGNVTEIRYKDTTREVRVYPGFNATSATSGTTTGPIVVMREDRATAGDSYVEVLSMSIAPNVQGSRPTGNESIGSVQTLARTFFSNAGQADMVREYFLMPSYSASVALGTQNVNYYQTEISYDQRGRPNRGLRGDGTISRTVYDSLGRPVSDWLGNSDTGWTDTSGATGMVKQATYVFDNGGIGDSHLTSVADGMGRTTVFAHDFRGRVITTTVDPSGSALLYETQYDNLDRVTLSSKDPGYYTTYGYNDSGRSMTITEPPSYYPNPGSVTTLAYNYRGHLQSLTDPNGNATQWTIDGAGRVTSETNQLEKTRSYKYDAVGNLTERTDRLGRITRYEYDDANRNTHEKWYGTDGTTLLRTISFDYDDAGRLNQATDPSAVYGYNYDALGRVKYESQSFAGFSPLIEYDTLRSVAGNATTLSATIGGTADFKNELEYDDLGRLEWLIQSAVGGTGANQVAVKRADFTYNNANQFTQISRHSATTATELAINTFYDYDSVGRLKSLIHTMDTTAPTSGWGTNVKAGYQYSYDAANRMTGIDSYIDGYQSYSYGEQGQITSENSTNYGYDLNGNRTDGTTIGTNNQLLADSYYSYTYDDEGNRLTRVDLYTAETDEYIWDHRNRLVEVHHVGPDVEPAEGWGATDGGGCNSGTWGCFSAFVLADSEGESLQVFVNPWTGFYVEYWTVDVSGSADEGLDYDSSYTAQSPGVVYSPGYIYFDLLHDSENETTESFAIHFRLQGFPESEIVLEADIFDVDGPSLLQKVTYAYDPFNQLVRRQFDADGDGSGAATDTFYSHQDGQIALQFDSPTATYPSHRYLWNPAAVDQLLADEKVTSSSAGTVLWPLADHLGTIRDLASHNSTTDATTIENHRVYDAFGNLLSETNAAIDEVFGYTGRLFDEATGLQNNLHRWYDPKTGRWISEDPIGFAGRDSNLSRYVANRPTDLIDPSGLAPPGKRLPKGWHPPQTVSTPKYTTAWGPSISGAFGIAGSFCPQITVSPAKTIWDTRFGLMGTFGVGFSPNAALSGMMTGTYAAVSEPEELGGWSGTIFVSGGEVYGGQLAIGNVGPGTFRGKSSINVSGGVTASAEPVDFGLLYGPTCAASISPREIYVLVQNPQQTVVGPNTATAPPLPKYWWFPWFRRYGW